jgi:predicted house-cleaning noncanonical NTP pyrophosphatase (MazG superfamily)
MLKFKFSKLVRDKIVEHQIALGAKPSFRTLKPAEHKRELVRKIIEEASEITKAVPEEIAGELADVQQALDDLAQLYGLSPDDIAKAQAVKRQKNGAFKKGLYIETLEVDEDDPWVKHYRQNADRYPEIQ